MPVKSTLPGAEVTVAKTVYTSTRYNEIVVRIARTHS